MTQQILVACHLIANLAWIGSIIAVGLLVARSAQPDSAGFGKAARAVYQKVSAPAFGISFLFGIVLIAREPGYFKMGWFHVKLTAALVVIALHHVIGGRAKKAEAGELTGDGGAQVMTLVLGLATAVVAFMVITRPF